jgi:transposase-like protein
MISLNEQRSVMRERDDGGEFQGYAFSPDVILMGLRWSIAYPLSTRHEELMKERGVNVDHPLLAGE